MVWYDNLFSKLEQLGDKEQAEKMSAYLKFQFPFLGIPKPKLKEFEKPYFKEGKNYDIDWAFIMECWKKDYREAQYIAIDYLGVQKKKLTVLDLEKLKFLIMNKSWWETVDSVDAFVGMIVLKDINLENVMLDWSSSNHLWLRRVAIDFQQEYKEKTNTELLEQIIVNNLGTKEFFLNKAIGWSLRDYSKVNPGWVSDFLEKYKDKLATLSIKEAGKYL